MENKLKLVQTSKTWKDIPASRSTRDELENLAVHSGLGAGVLVLFAGPSGTGKTLAASVLAKKLGKDLYRVDLARVVSKYIGETEKNLSALFDSSRALDAVLLFDEADALFGKRGKVTDSHDRYANLDSHYLLQNMEDYGDLIILTCNSKNNLDDAFLRRMHTVVNFARPDSAKRSSLWRRILKRIGFS